MASISLNNNRHEKQMRHSAESCILVAEDDCNDEHLLQWAFTKADLDMPAYFVHNGAEAMDYLLGTPPFEDRSKYPFPNLLLLDLRMPCVDGFELLSWLRKLRGLHPLAVVVMSGRSWQEDFERARRLGATACLNKSLDFTDLVAAIKGLAGKRHCHHASINPTNQHACLNLDNGAKKARSLPTKV